MLSFAACLGLLLLDTALYGLVALLLARLGALGGRVRGRRTRHKTSSPRPGVHITSSPRPGVRLVSLSKAYRLDRRHTRRALAGLDCSFSPGEVTGLLGHNGAGKSTTMRLLVGLEVADSGEVELPGRAPHTIGFCPQHSVLYPCLSPREHLTLYARLRGESADQVEDMLDR